MLMVTYDGLFQFSLVLIAVITLCVTINKKK
nr:MAG TPA: Putative Holin-like Toxin (Hol-Tox) [Caudoviricetes sp.]